MGPTAAHFPCKKHCVFVPGEGEQDAALQNYLIITIFTCVTYLNIFSYEISIKNCISLV